MRRALQILAAAIIVVTSGVWLAKGANTKFTKNRVQVKTVDPITEIEQVEWQDRFLPGVDFLGGGFVIAAVLVAGSFFIRKQTDKEQIKHTTT